VSIALYEAWSTPVKIFETCTGSAGA